MKIEIDEKVLNSYRKTYQEFMRKYDEEMPKDETLLIIALVSDMELMKELMNKNKKKGA